MLQLLLSNTFPHQFMLFLFIFLTWETFQTWSCSSFTAGHTSRVFKKYFPPKRGAAAGLDPDPNRGSVRTFLIRTGTIKLEKSDYDAKF